MHPFLRGLASIFDFMSVLRDPRVDEILERSDADAIRSDWEAVGEDLRRAAEKLAGEVELP